MQIKYAFSMGFILLLSISLVLFGAPDPLLALDPDEICTTTWCSTGPSNFTWTFNVANNPDPTFTFNTKLITCGGNFYADNHMAVGANALDTDDDILVWVNENFEDTGTYHGGFFQISTDHDDQTGANLTGVQSNVIAKGDVEDLTCYLVTSDYNAESQNVVIDYSYGYKYDTPTFTSGITTKPLVSNIYGVYIEPIMTPTTDEHIGDSYGIVQAGENDYNQFKGHMAIGKDATKKYYTVLDVNKSFDTGGANHAGEFKLTQTVDPQGCYLSALTSTLEYSASFHDFYPSGEYTFTANSVIVEPVVDSGYDLSELHVYDKIKWKNHDPNYYRLIKEIQTSPPYPSDKVILWSAYPGIGEVEGEAKVELQAYNMAGFNGGSKTTGSANVQNMKGIVGSCDIEGTGNVNGAAIGTRGCVNMLGGGNAGTCVCLATYSKITHGECTQWAGCAIESPVIRNGYDPDDDDDYTGQVKDTLAGFCTQPLLRLVDSGGLGQDCEVIAFYQQ